MSDGTIDWQGIADQAVILKTDLHDAFLPCTDAQFPALINAASALARLLTLCQQQGAVIPRVAPR